MNKTSILIVEDEIIISLDIKMRLRSLGLENTVVARSGEEALQKIAKENFDLVLMDIHLDGNIDGIDTTAKINEQSNVPVIFVTGNKDASTIKRAEKTKHVGFVFKPIYEKLLVTEIKKALPDFDKKLL